MLKRCVITEIREHDGWWYFRFGGGDFTEKLNALKNAFQHETERRYDENQRLWRVVANEESRTKLASIFPNAAGVIDGLSAQLSFTLPFD